MLRADIFLAAAARPGADKPRQSMEERIAAAATNGRTFDWLVANSEISWRHPADKI
jgi:hypothetical protein